MSTEGQLELAHLENLGPAVRAGALNGVAAVLELDLLRVLDLDLLLFLHAVTLGHLVPPGGRLRVTLRRAAVGSCEFAPKHVPIVTNSAGGTLASCLTATPSATCSATGSAASSATGSRSSAKTSASARHSPKARSRRPGSTASSASCAASCPNGSATGSSSTSSRIWVAGATSPGR